MGTWIGFGVITLIGIFWGGYVSSTLWGWFMVPLGVKAITYWHAVGLSALLNVLLGSRGFDTSKGEDSGRAVAIGLFTAFFIPLICISMGFLAKINL